MCIRKKIGVTSLPSRISFKVPESFASVRRDKPASCSE
jgi:hypothetical protein